MSYFDRVLGAAIFDLSGLPKDYYISVESADISWVQTIFQSLGLQGLLTASFQVDGFRHAVIQGAQCHAVIVRQSNCYVAILMRQNDALTSEDLAQWASSFDPTTLGSDPRFSST